MIQSKNESKTNKYSEVTRLLGVKHKAAGEAYSRDAPVNNRRCYGVSRLACSAGSLDARAHSSYAHTHICARNSNVYLRRDWRSLSLLQKSSLSKHFVVFVSHPDVKRIGKVDPFFS